ncbi:MAG: hypothetical protein AAFU85_27595 [Planctomycetota bacterium]
MNDAEDQEFAERIRRAFHAQEIPPRPADQSSTMRRETHAPIAGLALVVPLTVALVGVLIAIATWPDSKETKRSEQSESSRTVKVDSETKPSEPRATELVDDALSETVIEPRPSLASPPGEFEPNLASDVVVSDDDESPAHEEASRAGPLRKTVELINRCFADKRVRPEQLASSLVPWLAKEGHEEQQRASLRRALAEVGMPSGVKSVELVKPQTESWLQDPSRLMFRYRYNPAQLQSNIRDIVNAWHGDAIFDPVLDAIRDDRDGPRVDLRRELFAKFDGELLVTVDRHRIQGEERILFAIGLTDETDVRKAVERCVRLEPEVEKHKVGRSTVFDCGGVALCVAEGYLLISDVKWVLSALGRRSDGG